MEEYYLEEVEDWHARILSLDDLKYIDRAVYMAALEDLTAQYDGDNLYDN